MIGSHDAYTYQKPTNWLVNLIKPFWKTQKLDIKKQYELGVRVFDVRICSYIKDDQIQWQTAHGLAKFPIKFSSLESICAYFETNCYGSYIRIYLEDKELSESVLNEYLRQATIIAEVHKGMIWEIGTHYPWRVYHKCNDFKIEEYYCHLFNWNPNRPFKDNIKKLDMSSFSLPYYAKKHNPVITKEMIEDSNVVHFIDYIGIYP